MTIFLHEDSFNSRAPTFRNRSPTMFKADILAEGVSVWLCLDGEDFEDEGGVSRTTSFSPLATSAACLFESGLLELVVFWFLKVLLFRSNLSCIEDLSLSGISKPFPVIPPDLAETDVVEPFEVLQVKTLSSDLRSLVSSFIRWTAGEKI